MSCHYLGLCLLSKHMSKCLPVQSSRAQTLLDDVTGQQLSGTCRNEKETVE